MMVERVVVWHTHGTGIEVVEVSTAAYLAIQFILPSHFSLLFIRHFRPETTLQKALMKVVYKSVCIAKAYRILTIIKNHLRIHPHRLMRALSMIHCIHLSLIYCLEFELLALIVVKLFQLQLHTCQVSRLHLELVH
jgi:hypothetical protein